MSEDEPTIRVVGMTIDMANGYIEWDVPSYENLPESQRHPTIPNIQVLERAGPLRDVFNWIGKVYDYEMFEIHRCIGHMHIGGIEAWIRVAETDEIVCHLQTTYGDDPSKDENFLTSISVPNFDLPKLLPGDTEMRIV